MMPEWVAHLMACLEHKIPKDFVGQVEVNIFKGGVTNVNVRQSHKKETGK